MVAPSSLDPALPSGCPAGTKGQHLCIKLRSQTSAPSDAPCGRTDGAVRCRGLELFEVEIFPEDVAGRAAVDLEAEEAFGGEVFFVGVGEVGAEFAIEPSLQVVALTLDDDGVPVVPFEELFALGGEGVFVLLEEALPRAGTSHPLRRASSKMPAVHAALPDLSSSSCSH